MKKFFTSVVFIFAFSIVAIDQYFTNLTGPSYAATEPPTSAPASSVSAPSQTIASAAPPPNTTPTTPASSPALAPAATPTPTPTPAAPSTGSGQAKPQGQYIDGTYTGSVADAYYGSVQVQATVSGGRLTAVSFLQYPNDRSTSRMINGQAMPLLSREAVQAQSAQVDGVSGASDTSYAFVQSLSSALAKAKN